MHFIRSWIFTLILLSCPSLALSGSGAFLHGVGAIDSSLGGSTTALPQDTIGAIYSNVASTTELPGLRMDFGLELLKPETTLGSSAGGVTGLTKGRSAISPIPAFGLISSVPGNQQLTFFMGALGVGGFGVNYPQDDANPILKPQVQNGTNTGGFGHIYSSYQLTTIAFGLAAKITDRLSIGFSPNIGYATLSVHPMPAATPDCAPGPVCSYPDASDRATSLGVGFQAGLFYKVTDSIRIGLSYTSPKWFQPFRWNSQVANPASSNFGSGREITFQLDTPQVVGLGIALLPNEFWALSINTKWINYGNTKGYDDEGFDPTGRVKGLGWKDIWAFGVGIQYSPIPVLSFRVGYNFTQSPIAERVASVNVASPAIAEHHLTSGIGLKLSSIVDLNLAYYHAFNNELTGPIVTPMGVTQGTVSNTLSYDSLILQLGLRI